MAKTTFGNRLLALEKDSGLEKSGFHALMGAKADALRRWKNDEVLPNVKYLFTLLENFYTLTGRRINMAWLLTGDGDRYIYKGIDEDLGGMGIADPAAQYEERQPGKPGPDPYRQASKDLLEIYNYGDVGIITAIQANLTTFLRTVRRERQVAQQAEEIKELKAECEVFKEKNNELEKRISTLESKLTQEDERVSIETEPTKTARAGV